MLANFTYICSIRLFCFHWFYNPPLTWASTCDEVNQSQRPTLKCKQNVKDVVLWQTITQTFSHMDAICAAVCVISHEREKLCFHPGVNSLQRREVVLTQSTKVTPCGIVLLLHDVQHHTHSLHCTHLLF